MLARLSRLLRAPQVRNRAARPAPQPPRPRRRPSLEVLEDRTVLSNLFVVPTTTPGGGNNFFTLSAAVKAANPGDVITIEPGSTPGFATVATNGGGTALNNLTIQGDPNSLASSLPGAGVSVGSATTNVTGVVLHNLNLFEVFIANGSTGEQVTGSLVGFLSESGGAGAAGHNTISNNTITDAVSINGGGTTTSSGDTINNNTFNAAYDFTASALTLNKVNGAVVQANAFNLAQTSANPVTGISLTDSTGVNVRQNTITIQGGTSANAGISIGYTAAMVSSIVVDGNFIKVSPGNGLAINVAPNTDANVQVVVQGNAFNTSSVGVAYTGNTGIPGSTLGGTNSTSGAVSLGGNNFRQTGTAIAVTNIAAAASLPAQFNIFGIGAPPNVSGATDTTNSQNEEQAFVTNLYRNVLLATPSQGQVNSWTTLAVQNQPLVAANFLLSNQGLLNQVNQFYEQFLHRSIFNDPVGQSFFLTELRSGTSLETVEAQILTSPEFIRLSGGGGIQTYYQLLLGRTASVAELAFWQGQLASKGQMGVVEAIIGSTEAQSIEISRLYQQLLHRAPSQSDVNFWATQGQLKTELGLLSSTEFLANG